MLVATGCGMVDMVLSMAGRTSWNLVNVAGRAGRHGRPGPALIPRLGALGRRDRPGRRGGRQQPAAAGPGRAARCGCTRSGRGTLAAGAARRSACFGVLPRSPVALTGPAPPVSRSPLGLAVPAFAAGAWLLRCSSPWTPSPTPAPQEDALTTDYTKVFQDADAVEKYETRHLRAGQLRLADQRPAARLPARPGQAGVPRPAPVQHDFACGTGRAIRTAARPGPRRARLRHVGRR